MSITAEITNVKLQLRRKPYSYTAQLAASSVGAGRGFTTMTPASFERGIAVASGATGESVPLIAFDDNAKFAVPCNMVQQIGTVTINLTVVKDLGPEKISESIKKYAKDVQVANGAPPAPVTLEFGHVGSVSFSIRAQFSLQYELDKTGVPAIASDEHQAAASKAAAAASRSERVNADVFADGNVGMRKKNDEEQQQQSSSSSSAPQIEAKQENVVDSQQQSQDGRQPPDLKTAMDTE